MSSGKSGAKTLFASALVLLSIASAGIASAEEAKQIGIYPEPIKVSFGETFTLSQNQTAFIEEYQIILQDTLNPDITCIDGACPEAPAPIAVLAVFQKKSDGLEYLVQEKVYLKQNAEAEVLGIKIKSLAN